jgi:hypothetical protein
MILLETWRTYVKKKYKTALDRWNKDTGGGNGRAWSFINYCDQESRWLVMVFLQDLKANYLLASNAAGRMPTRLQFECGFDAMQDMSSLETAGSSDTDGGNSAGNGSISKKRALVEAEADNKKLRTKMEKALDKMDNCFEMINNLCQYKRSTPSEEVPIPVAPAVQVRSSDNIFEEVVSVNHALNDTESVKSMSPRTKEVYYLSLQTRRKRLLKQLLELEQEEERKNTEN